MSAAVQPVKGVLPAGTPGVDSLDFVKADRIQVKDGSLFIDGYLVLHPHELAPENEAKLTKKLELTYSMNNPSFYESKDRLAIGLNLGQLIPVSLSAKHSKLQDEITSYNHQVESGTDAELLKLNSDKQHPFAAIVRDTIEKPTQDPVGVETLKNGLSLYLLMREKLTSMGYRNSLSTYVTRMTTPDQVLTDLGDKIGIAPLAIREAALKGGIDGVGQLLQLDPAYVKDVKAFVETDAKKEFSLNAIEHWHQGRHILGVAAPISQKITAGMQARITKAIGNARERVHHFYEVPEPIKHEEEQVAQAMNVLEPIQRALMFKLGYEICYTPEAMADSIAFYPGIYGLHRKAANDLHDDMHSTNRVYYAGRGNVKEAWRVLAHECAHLLKPEQFSAEEVKTIDALADSDKARFAKLNTFMDKEFTGFDRLVGAYRAGTPEQQVAILAEATHISAKYGVDVAPAIPYLQNGQDFLFLVTHAQDTLQDEGARYARSGYNSPHERFREVISRFAELKQVEYAAQPQLLHFVAPGLDQIWEAHYIPHLHRVYQTLEHRSLSAANQMLATDGVPAVNGPAVATNPTQMSPKMEQHPDPEPVNPTPVATLPPHEPASAGTTADAVTATTPMSPVSVTPAPVVPPTITPDPVTPPVMQAPTPSTGAPVQAESPVSITPPIITPPAITPDPVTPPAQPAPTPAAVPIPAPIITSPTAAANADMVPDFVINGAQHGGKMSEQSIAAMNTLATMGIHAHR